MQGLASRAIASQLGLSKTTINNLAARIQSGTQEQRQQLAHMPDSVLLEFFYPPIVKAKEEPDWIDIHKKLYRRGVTLTLLYKQYKAQAVRETYNYASFCRRYGEWRKTNGVDAPGGNIERIPGERMEIDFAGDSLKWIDPDCNVRYARVFVAVLPYSNLTYAEAFDNEKQPSWIAGVVHALNFIGGTPQVLVMDNAEPWLKRRIGTRERCSKRSDRYATTTAWKHGLVSRGSRSRKTELRPASVWRNEESSPPCRLIRLRSRKILQI